MRELCGATSSYTHILCQPRFLLLLMHFFKVMVVYFKVETLGLAKRRTFAACKAKNKFTLYVALL